MQTAQLLQHWLTPRNLKRQLVPVLLTVGLALGIGLLYHSAFAAFFAAMSWQAWLTLAVTVTTFLGSAISSLPTEIVFLGGTAVLFLSGVLDEETALAGFSNSGMITVAVLYIVVTGLQQTGGLAAISQNLLGLPKGETAALMRLTAPIMGMSAFLNNTPLVAMFIPVVDDWCRKLRISPSKLMIPLSYAAILGGVCTLIGTSTNLVVAGLLTSLTDRPDMKLLDITPIGLPVAIFGMLYLWVAHRWLLPSRKAVLSETDDMRQYTVEMIVESGSPLAGKTVEQAGLRHLPGLYLAEIMRDSTLLPAVSPKETLRENDRLVFVGIVDSVVDLHRLRGLQPATDQVFKLDTPRSERCLIEAVVSNTCALVGKTIREGEFRSKYNAVVIAVARNGERLQGKIGDIRLRAGDTLLLEAHPSFLNERRISRDFYLVGSIPDSEPLRHDKAFLALGIVVAMVLLAAFDVMSMLEAAILASVAMLATGCCSPGKALRSIEWPVLLVIGAALGLGAALESTGIAESIASAFLGIVGNNPWMALAAVFCITTVMTEVITNNAAAALIFPIAIAIARSLDVNFMPFVITVMIGASCSFSTPIGYQTNMMVYAPGGYKFTDFTRIGLPLNFIAGIVTILLAPRFYPF
jgi:di/tricarboxylate transporter